jgi:hypothetical protein
MHGFGIPQHTFPQRVGAKTAPNGFFVNWRTTGPHKRYHVLRRSSHLLISSKTRTLEYLWKPYRQFARSISRLFLIRRSSFHFLNHGYLWAQSKYYCNCKVRCRMSLLFSTLPRNTSPNLCSFFSKLCAATSGNTDDIAHIEFDLKIARKQILASIAPLSSAATSSFLCLTQRTQTRYRRRYSSVFVGMCFLMSIRRPRVALDNTEPRTLSSALTVCSTPMHHNTKYSSTQLST